MDSIELAGLIISFGVFVAIVLLVGSSVLDFLNFSSNPNNEKTTNMTQETIDYCNEQGYPNIEQQEHEGEQRYFCFKERKNARGQVINITMEEPVPKKVYEK